ncbi:MAG: lytic transglycosylase domain-containing protein [Pseudomonadota bacterium]
MNRPALKFLVVSAFAALAPFAIPAVFASAVFAQDANDVTRPVDEDAMALTRAFAAMNKGDWTEALDGAKAAGPVAQDIIEWHRLRAGDGSLDEVTSFLDRNADWPGLPYLRRQNEANLPFGDRPRDVIAFFADQAPRTGAGSINLIAAYESLGQASDAKAQAVLAWLTQTMSAQDEALLLGNYGDELKDHHEARLDMLLWNGHRVSSERMYPRVSSSWRALGRARIALRQNKNGVDTLIGNVPKDLQDHPGLLFERFQWRARKGLNARAIEILIAVDGTEVALGQPERWASWRRGLARATMRDGDGDLAYRIASAHGLTTGSDFADLEWLSGYLALTYLDAPEAALDHFQRFETAVATPISLGRAGYWQGRALEAMDQPEAALAAYTKGAAHQTAFYGQLAAERAGVAMDVALTGGTIFPDWRDASFTSSTVFQAALLLQRAGQRSLAERFMVHLAETQDAIEIGQLADVALELDEPHIAVMIGKQGARQGMVIPKAYFPVVDFGLDDLGVPAELALAIARRESEFDPVVVSGAGARGLMQLMPATAREVAGELGLPYSRARLTSDPVYNAALGTEYLDMLIDMMSGNLAMVAAGYNAGPGRPRQWAARFGDPRSGGMDPVDWIEHIPFSETRNYAMRVMESLPVYRARLSGQTAPWTVTQDLTRSSAHFSGTVRPRARPQPQDEG